MPEGDDIVRQNCHRSEYYNVYTIDKFNGNEASKSSQALGTNRVSVVDYFHNLSKVMTKYGLGITRSILLSADIGYVTLYIFSFSKSFHQTTTNQTHSTHRRDK